MEGKYDVFLGDRPVGQVHVTKQGLYYRFVCNCSIEEKAVCRLRACWQDRQESLGVLVPAAKGFGLDTKVAAKRCGRGVPEFYVISGKTGQGEKFVPLSPEEPFAYIQRLKDAYFERRYGEPGIVLRDTQMP